ncbi:AF4/FMR2 family member 1-like isoform X2 [Micropterus salmoides]|uniref:AF4/FMR2 family member 1-like isoform X2 n=1 Tax=Micropterus salmoides TaxID=27706 RepID=UPI0018EBCA2D|nr:AF4/FMR2 family member 1-like isoform X2 [Micropterus salmoides]
MTTNFGCCERRTMASQPSVYNEDRNLLRLRAWEQRNQETSQAKELNSENVPLFGQPYKTNKGDELSNRIQRMLGSYEDVNNPYPFAIEALPIPTYLSFSQSDQGLPNMDKPTKLPFHNQVHYMNTQSQKPPSSTSYSSQPMMSTASSPNRHGHSSTFSNASLNHSEGSKLSHSAHQQIKSEPHLDLRECASLSQEMSSQSPDVKPLPFLRSSDHDKTDTDTKETFDGHQIQGCTDLPLESVSTMDVSTFNQKQSPKDASLPQGNKGNALPSQTFPSLLSSKQPSVVMTQKPTAYVRPMDGQDQVVSESPELKPSPEPYVPLPELINKSDLGKTKILPQFLETRTNEVQCVEDILREMTHSWPPLLTAIHTPSTGEPSKSPFPAKEAEHVSSCPGQKKCESSPADPSQLIQQGSSSSFQAAHSRGVESASSSDSESSSRSESDSESTTEEPPKPPVSISVKTEPEAPAVNHGDWQLGNWIRPSQQSSSSEGQSGQQASESLAHKPPPTTQSPKHSSVEVVDPARESKPQLSSHPKEFTEKPQQHCESPQDSYNQQSSQPPPSADLNSCSSSRKLSCNTHSSKPTKTGCPDHTEAAIGVKCEEVVATQDKDPRFKDRPKVKTKTGHGKKSKDSRDTKRLSKRTKHTSLDKRKAGSEPQPQVKLTLNGACPSCSVRYPNPCSCPTQSPVQPDQLSPVPPVRLSCSKPKSGTTCQKDAKIPHKTTHKLSEKTGHKTKSSRDPHRPPRSLLVKIDLSLLLRVPQTSGNHQEIPRNAKRSALVIEQDDGGSDACTTHKLSKTSKKSIPQNVEVDNKTIPRKKPRLENKNTSSTHASLKLESSSNSKEDRDRKKAKKNPVPLQQPLTPKDTAKDSKSHTRSSGETQESSKDAVKSKDSCKHKKSSGKHTEHPHFEKKPPKSSLAVTSSSQPAREALTNRPLLRLEDRQYPVKHYIKEAKKLKHKADAESDKLSKAFNYLDAAMYFVESGIAMEKDPQISMSSYTMFAETVELLKFVLKLKNSVDPSAPPSEKDFLALCLKCQSLLQMAMFRHKHKTALKYSKTLTDHFNSSAQTTHDPSVLTSKVTHTPSPSIPSPANTSTSSGPSSNHSGSGLVVDPVSSTVAVPQAIEQVAFAYVNITTLFLSAHDVWEQAEELAQKGSAMLTELDTVMGPLSLSSSMSSMVHYTRQGVHWLRLDSQKKNKNCTI